MYEHPDYNSYKLSVSTNTIYYIISQSGRHSIVYYYDNNNRLVYHSSTQFLNQCCVFAYTDGYMYINYQNTYIPSIYTVKNPSILKQIGNSITKESLTIKDYAITRKSDDDSGIVFNVEDETFTIKSGTYIIGRNNVSYRTEEDLTTTRNDAAGNSGYVIFDNSTKTIKQVGTLNPRMESTDQIPICFINWHKHEILSNNMDFYTVTNGVNSIEHKNKIELDSLYESHQIIKFSDDMFVDGYYTSTNYPNSDDFKEVINPSIIKNGENQKFRSARILLKGKVLIFGQGGSASSSRLYCVTDLDNIIISGAEKGINSTVVPSIVETKKLSYVYITNSNSDGYIVIFQNYEPEEDNSKYINIVVNNYNELNDNYDEVVLDLNKSLTVKKSSFLIGKHIGHIDNLSEDIVINKPDDGYGTHYIIFKKVNKNTTITYRCVRYNDTVILEENEDIFCVVKWSTGIIKSNLVCYRLGDRVVYPTNIRVTESITAPKMYNPILNLQKDQFKVLDIGNSYTDDSTHYLPQIVTASGVDTSNMCLYKAVRGGASFKNWYDIYFDRDTSNYSVSKILGGIDQNITGTAEIGNGERFRNTLKNNEWDLIIIHQVSTYSPYYDRWEEDSDAGYLSKYIRILRQNQPKATIGFLLVHSYWSDYSGNTEKSSLNRWKLIAESVKRLRANYDIDFVIPYGTAIQNLRASSLNNGYDLTIDGTHNADGIADYTAACCYYQSLFASRYGVGILGNTARINISDPNQGTYPSSNISVTDDNALTCQKSAFLACYNWYECQNPDNFTDLTA